MGFAGSTLPTADNAGTGSARLEGRGWENRSGLSPVTSPSLAPWTSEHIEPLEYAEQGHRLSSLGKAHRLLAPGPGDADISAMVTSNRQYPGADVSKTVENKRRALLDAQLQGMGHEAGSWHKAST